MYNLATENDKKQIVGIIVNENTPASTDQSDVEVIEGPGQDESFRIVSPLSLFRAEDRFQNSSSEMDGKSGLPNER